MPISSSTAIAKEIARRIKRFQGLLEAARKSPTPKTIHDIRVSIRRLEAAADFYRSLSDDPRLSLTTDAVNSLMEPLGRLRDFHVQRELIAPYVSQQTPRIERFVEKLRRLIEEQEQTVVNAIRIFPKKGLSIFAAAVRKKLAADASDATRSYVFLKQLAVHAQKPVEKCKKRYEKNQSMKMFHKMRIALKHLRYTGEMLVPVVPEITMRAVERIHALQREMGHIHDQEVLAAALKNYLDKKNDDANSRDQLKKIVRTRDVLLGRFNRRIGKIKLFAV